MTSSVVGQAVVVRTLLSEVVPSALSFANAVKIAALNTEEPAIPLIRVSSSPSEVDQKGKREEEGEFSLTLNYVFVFSLHWWARFLALISSFCCC